VSSDEPLPEGLVPRFARPALRAGDPTGWFEPMYAAAGDSVSDVPWVDLAPNRHLVEWLEREGVVGDGRRAVVVGCGLGDDAELLRSAGFDAVGFDIAPTAAALAARRFPEVDFRTADLLALPRELVGAFPFVFEAYTVQSLPVEIRSAAIDGVASLVAPDGTLLVVTFGRTAEEDPGRLPWPLTRDDLARFGERGLVETRFEEYRDVEESERRRFRVRYTRPS
jgi:ubiquinone/menaquinone biosynthesis C-methylase UbiE